MQAKNLVGKPLTVFVASDDIKSFRTGLAALTNSKQSGTEQWEMVLQPRDGTAFRALISVMSTHHDKEGTKVRWSIHDTSQLWELQEQRQMLFRRLLNAQEDERARIARDMHDKMAQLLTTLSIELRSLKAAAGDAVASEIEKLQKLTEEIGSEVHHIASELRPAALDELGFVKALSNFVEEWSRETGIKASFHQSGPTESYMTTEIKTGLYRIVQQCLTNVLKHAKASQVSIVLERREEMFLVIVEDNGVGFDVDSFMKGDARKRALGLIGMKERAALVGGTLDIESKQGAGTTIFVRIPISSDEIEEGSIC